MKNTAFLVILGIALAFMPFSHALAGPYLTLDKYSGNAGAEVAVSGGGFAAGERVAVVVGANRAVAAAAAAAGGFGPVKVRIPQNTPAGRLVISAAGETSGFRAENFYYVTPLQPYLDIASSANTPGSKIQVSGSGFAPGEGVSLRFGQTDAGSAKADSRGGFGRIAVTIPETEPGTYLIRGTGNTSRAEALGYFYVGGFYPTANPDVFFVLPEQAITFSGGGFRPGETVEIYIGENPAPVASFKASGKGDFINAGKYVIPPSLAGTNQDFRLKGTLTPFEASALVTVGAYNALVSPDSYYAMPGNFLNFYGRGFAPNEKIQVIDSGSGDVLKVVAADKNGGFVKAGQLAVPFSAAGGNQAFRFVGQRSGAAATATVSIGSFVPQVSPSEYFLTPGKEFTVWGKGFAPFESVAISAEGKQQTVKTDKYGVFKVAGPFAAPFSPGSQVGVLARGQSSLAQSKISLDVGSLYPNIVPERYYAVPGDQIKLSGYGFAPGEKVLLQVASSTISTISTDRFGNFTGKVVSLPFEGGLKITYSLVGEKSGAGSDINISTAKLAPVLEASTYYAHPGGNIRVQATGFSKGEPVTIAGGNTTVAAVANKDGYVPWTVITLPLDLNAKSVTLTITGNATEASGSATINLAPFRPQVAPSTYFTPPGSRVNFSGSGFMPGEKIFLALNGTRISELKADSKGGLSLEGFILPFGLESAGFEFFGELSKSLAVAEVSMAKFAPQVYPSSYHVNPGAQITFSGSGFAPGEVVEINFDGQSAGTAKADAKGKITTGKISLPYQASSDRAGFVFKGTLSGAVSSVDLSLAALKPSLALSTYYDAGGKPLTVKGYGFGSNERVEVAFGSQVLGAATADQAGAFSLKAAVPFGSPGQNQIKARGSSSGASASAVFQIP